MMWSFATVAEALARTRPEQRAVVYDGHELTWAELDDRAGRLAAGLRARGVLPGEVVAHYLPNRPEYLETFLACAKSGLVHMNTNYRYVDGELLEVWQDADVRVVVYDRQFADRIEQVRDRMPDVRLWLEVGGHDQGAPNGSTMGFETLVAEHEPLEHGSDDPDTLVLIYTGGTTGRPKGVMWRHADLTSMLNAVNRKPLPDVATPDQLEDEFSTRRRGGAPTIVASPLMHGAGLFFAISSLMNGGAVCLLPGLKYEPELLLDTVEARSVVAVSIVGDAFARPLLGHLDAEPDRWDLSSLRAIASSGVMWSRDTKEGLLRHLPHVRLVDGLGSSEASAIASTESTAGTVAETASFKVTERGAVILDDGSFAQPGDGQVGRLAVSGWLPLGYLNDPEKTAQVFIEAGGKRWSTPGDLAQVEADGTIRLLGRGSACINTGGEKVFPEEVEEVLKEHHHVVDAAVVGVPSERFGQTVVAIVEPSVAGAVEADVLDVYLRERLAGYKVPRLLTFVDSVDRLPNGKLDHRRLRELAGDAWQESVNA